MNKDPIDSKINFNSDFNIIDDYSDSSKNWTGRIVKGVPSGFSKNPMLQKILHLGTKSLLSAHVDLTLYSQATFTFKKIVEGIHEIQKPLNHIELTTEDLNELRDITNKSYKSEEMSSQDSGYFGIKGYARQILNYSNLGGYAKYQQDLNDMYKVVKSEIDDLEIKVKNRPILIKNFEIELTQEILRLKNNIVKGLSSPAELAKQKEDLMLLFNSDRAWGTLEETKNIKLMQREVEEIFIPTVGTHIRNEQTRYMLEGKIIGNQLQTKSLLPGFKSAIKIATEESSIIRLAAQIDDIEKNYTNSIINEKVLNTLISAVNRNPELYHKGSDRLVFDKSLYKIYTLLNRMGVEPLQYDYLAEEQLKDVAKTIKSFTVEKNAVLFQIPAHSMLIVTDPENNIYRFYDPNTGIYRFNDPEIFAASIAKYTSETYNKNWCLFNADDPESAQDPGFVISSETMHKNNLEVRISQATERTVIGDLGFGKGICLALSAHVAKNLLQLHDLEAPLTTKSLGLEEFDETKIRKGKAKNFINQKKYDEAILEYLHLFRLIPSDKRDAELDSIYKTSGFAQAFKFADKKGYFKDKASLGFSQATILNKIVIANKLKLNNKKQGLLKQEEKLVKVNKPVQDELKSEIIYNKKNIILPGITFIKLQPRF